MLSYIAVPAILMPFRNSVMINSGAEWCSISNTQTKTDNKIKNNGHEQLKRGANESRHCMC